MQEYVVETGKANWPSFTFGTFLFLKIFWCDLIFVILLLLGGTTIKRYMKNTFRNPSIFQLCLPLIFSQISMRIIHHFIKHTSQL